MTDLSQKRKLQQGVIPLFLVVLIFLVLIGGGGYAFTQLASPECQDLSLVTCLFNPSKKLDRQKREVEIRQVAKEQGIPDDQVDVENANYSEENKKWEGDGVLRFNFTKLDPTEQKIDLRFDLESVQGDISLTNQGAIAGITIGGLVDPQTGTINATVSGESTQEVSQGKIQGSITTSFSGQFTGKINKDGSASGTMVLVQKVVASNIESLPVGKTDTVTLPWSGNVEKDY